MFWNSWTALWNGDLTQAPGIISRDLATHATMMDGSSSALINGPEAMAGWIGQLRSVFDNLVFETIAGPIADEGMVAGHWRATGAYIGGMPGAKAREGTEISFTGTDVIRLADGKAVEYWLVSDTLSLLAQLDALGVQ